MRVKKLAIALAVPVVIAFFASVAVPGVVKDYTYDQLGNTIREVITSELSPTVTISANPAYILPGGSSTLTWTSTNATSCSIDPDIGNVPVAGSITITPSATTTYTITATRDSHTATSSVTVTVTANPPPTVTITANPAAIQQGGSANLSWTSSNAESCTIDQGIGAVQPNVNGSTLVTPAVTTMYTITATGPGGTQFASTTITVTVAGPTPTVTISANPQSIPYGDSSTLSWSSTNADWCDIQPHIGIVSPSSYIPVSPLATTTYFITAYGQGGTATSTVTVTVVPPSAPTVQISANPATIVKGNSTTLAWTSTNAESCDIQPDVGIVGPNWSLGVSPDVTTTYTITAFGPGGTATATVIVTVTAAPGPSAPTVSISANPRTIVAGASSTLSWTATNATSCTIDQGIGTVNTNGSTQVSPTANTTYTITATGAGGTSTDSVTVAVLPCDISLHDETIVGGSTVEQTTACNITAGPNYIIEANATVTFLAGRDIILTDGFEARNGCEFRAGYNGAVPSVPTVTLSATPAMIQEGESSTLTWTSTHVSSCSIDQGIGNVNTSGSTTVSPQTTTTYTITATGTGGTATAHTTITVTPPSPTQTITLRPNANGDSTQLLQNPNSGSHYDKVDDTVADGATTSVYWKDTGSTYKLDLFGLENHTIETGVIRYVKVYWRAAHNENSTTGYGKSAIKIGGNVYYGTERSYVQSNGWQTFSDQWYTNPSSGISWSWTDIDNLQAGVALQRSATIGENHCTQVYVEVNYFPLPTVNLGADPATIQAGGSSTLSWTSTNATSCTIDQGIGTVNTSGSTTVSPSTTTTYTITATWAGGISTQSVTVTVAPLPAPTVTISANPASIQYGGSATLTWTATNATSCSIDHGIGSVNTSGSTTVTPQATTIYTITATGAGGTATNSVTITVALPPAPTVNITANPATIVPGASSTLTWTSTNAELCSIDQGIGVVTISGSMTVSPATTTTYTITATGTGGSANNTATVTVASPSAPTVSISANPTSIQAGGSANLTWSSTNATSCTINQGIGGVGTSGTRAVSPTSTTTYTITATGAGGTATNNVTITVTPPPTPQSIIIRPNAAGDETNISSQQPASGSHYDKVDEVTTDESATHVSEVGASVIYHRDLYNLENSSLAGTVNWIKAWMRVGNTSGRGYAKTAIKTGGTVYEGSEIQAPAGWTNYSTQYTTNPKTGVAWTWNDINGLQAGVSLKGGGWLTGWGYRKSITLSRPSGSVTGYQMKLLVGETAGAYGEAVDCGGKCKTDFSDLRFATVNGVTLLPYWIESISGSTPNQLATIWIKFDSIGTSATTFYMYYGNASASSASSGTNTFDLFDDFSGTLSFWNITGSVSIVSGICQMTGSNSVIDSKAQFGLGYSVRALSKAVTLGDYSMAVEWRNQPETEYARFINFSGFSSTYESANDAGGGTVTDVVQNTNYHVREVSRIASNSVKYYVDDVLKATRTRDSTVADRAGARANGKNVYVDWIVVRKILATEPAWGSWGSEEVGAEVGGLDSDCTQVYVEVNYTPSTSLTTVSISADPATIQAGGSSTLTWSSTNATACTIDQGIGSVNTSGSMTVSPQATTTYTITATGAEGTVTNNLTLTVLPCDLSLHDEAIPAGNTIEHTTACTITAGPNYIIEPNATVTFKAGQGITLKPGFKARQGCTFRAMHRP